MSKRGKATNRSIKHGVQSHPIHKADMEEQRRRMAVKKKFVIREEMPEDAYPAFKSDVSKLLGKSYVVTNGRPQRVGETLWLEKITEAQKEFSWYHNNQNRCRKIPGGDLQRKTIDLRPDHSRVIQYLLEEGRDDQVQTSLERIQAKKVELYERIYHRKVLFSAEHTDSGQHHNDLWHTGIEVLKDTITPKKSTWYEDKLMPKGVPIPLRKRTEHREFGIGVGAASWSRHLSAFKESGMEDEEIFPFFEATWDAIMNNFKRAEERRNEPPRDYLLQIELDEFVRDELKGISPKLYDRALGEYVLDRRRGYEAGLLGVKKGKEEKLLDKVLVLERALAEEKGALEKEQENTARLAAWTRVLLSGLGEKTKLRLLEMGGQVGNSLKILGKYLGISLPKPEGLIDVGSLPGQITMGRPRGLGMDDGATMR